MVKIIISGTHVGYKNYYASDGILSDAVTHVLKDDGDLFKKETRVGEDWIEGYCVQPVPEIGILYHKIITLRDYLSRWGFMRISLFLPKGTLLKGKEIKDALDNVFIKYVPHIENSHFKSDIDWSYVKDEADRLSACLRNVDWSMPIKEGTRNLLLRGAENRVEEFFDYPNPLHNDFSGYQTIYLTESLLDTNASFDVKNAAEVDTTIKKYRIVYNNPYKYHPDSLKNLPTEIEKEKLDGNEPSVLGPLIVKGYKVENVVVNRGNIDQSDGVTICVDLPNLDKKKAFVGFRFLTDSVANVKQSRVSWQRVGGIGTPKPGKTNEDGLYIFEGDECDCKWKYSVQISGYNDAEDEIYISDSLTPQVINVCLTAKTAKKTFDNSTEGGTPGSGGKTNVPVVQDDKRYVKLNEESRGYFNVSKKCNKAKSKIMGKEDKYRSLDNNSSDTQKFINDLCASLQDNEAEKVLQTIAANKNKYGKRKWWRSLRKIVSSVDILKSSHDNVYYEGNKHRLVYVGKNASLAAPKTVSFKSSFFYSYKLLDSPQLDWKSEKEASEFVVKRKLRAWVWLLLLCLVATLAIVMFGRSGDNDNLTQRMNEFTSQYSNATYFVGDSIYANMNSLKTECIKAERDTNDETYKNFDACIKKQLSLKTEDGKQYAKFEEFKEKYGFTSDSLDIIYRESGIDSSKMSLEHRENVRKFFNEAKEYQLKAESQEVIKPAETGNANGKSGSEKKSPNAQVKNTQQTQKKVEATPVEPSNNSQKKKINNRTELYFALTIWDNVKDNGKLFWEKYEITNEGIKKNVKKYAEDAITKANRMGKDKYMAAIKSINARRVTDADNHLKDGDLMTELEKMQNGY